MTNMNDIAGIPYVDAQFDKSGTLQSPVALPAGVTDCSSCRMAGTTAPTRPGGCTAALFTNFVAVARPNDLPGRSFAIVGVIWPSKEFDELVAVAGAPAGALGRGRPPRRR